MSFRVVFFKDRLKFSAAHFTLFADGEVERLHGHNFRVEVTLEGKQLEKGLLLPFHHVKPVVDELCAEWDERVLLPARSAWLRLEERDGQIEAHLKTPKCRKYYSLPAEDVVLLDCDNISSENLAQVFLNRLATRLESMIPRLIGLEVAISESSGQKVVVTTDFDRPCS